MSEFTRKILEALGLGLAGLIATVFVIINQRLKRRFDRGDDVKKKPIQSIDLVGHWAGDGWRYSLKVHLYHSQAMFEGQIEWTLQGFPQDYDHQRWVKKRLGRSGIEFVRGPMTNEKLTLSGYRLDDPHETGLLLADYSIDLNEKAQSFEGTSVNHSDKKTGILTGFASVQRMTT